MPLNSLQKALVNNGFAQEPKQKKTRHKKYNCKKCGKPMVFIDDTNVMACTNEKCNNYFIFDK